MPAFNFRRPRFSSTSAALQLRDMLRAQPTLDFPSTAAAATSTLTTTVTGARVGDDVLVTPTTPVAGLVYSGYVSANDTVTVRVINVTASPVDPASQVYGVVVFTRF